MSSNTPVVYRSGLTDSSRWERFISRPGDIIISAPSKCGTTWLQMICAMLIFQDTTLPGPLTALSPWLDMRLRPIEDVLAGLDAQAHPPFIKTHTPLDGLPATPGVAYVTVGRDPLDVAVSMDHHRANLDGNVIETLLAPTLSQKGPDERAAAVRPPRPADQHGRLLQWIHGERPPAENLDSLRGVVHHLAGAWARRDDPTVTLMHYADLARDLEGEMRRLADRLSISVPHQAWPALVRAATFGHMRDRASQLVPDEQLGLLTDRRAFFRSAASRQWTEILTGDDLAAYHTLLGSLAPADLAEWIQHGQGQPTRSLS